MSERGDPSVPVCELCCRHGVELTRHHLIPRTRHSNKKARRTFARAEMHNRILLVCRACHKQIHALFTEKELTERYHDRHALLAHQDMARFVHWIRSKPPGFVPTAQRSRRRR